MRKTMKKSLFKLTVIAAVIILSAGCTDPTAPSDDKSYTISYFANGASVGTVPVDSTEYKEGDSVTVADNTGSLSKTNYLLEVWNTSADGSGTSYSAGSTLTMPAAYLELYATWQFSPNPLSFTDANAGFTGLTLQPACCAADVDGDGDQDLFFAGNGAQAVLYRNNGSGIFTSGPADEFSFFDYVSADFADVDNDGDPDLVLAGRSGSAFAAVFLNDGAGSFTANTAGLTARYQGDIAIGDVDNDGYIDLLIHGTTDGTTYQTTLYLNDGVSGDTWGGFTDSEVTFSNLFSGSTAIGDINGDGYADLLITGKSAAEDKVTELYINDGDSDADGWDGTFTEDTTAPLPDANNSGGIFADLDSDGDNDILFAGYADTRKCTVYLNDGLGLLTLSQELTGISIPIIVPGDADADGDIDLIICGYVNEEPYGPRSIFYRNDGTGNFTGEDMGLTPMNYGDGCFFDADGDSDLDLALCGNDGGTGYAQLYLNGRLE